MTTSFLDRGQRAGLRLLTRAGSLPLLRHDAVRSRVERALYRGAAGGFAAQGAVGRVFPLRRGLDSPARTGPRSSPGLFDLTPTEDQEMLRAAARELAEEVLRPAARSADTERAVPETVLAAATEMGLSLLGVPAALGGIADESSAVTTCLVLEELSRGDMGLTAALMATGSVAALVSRYGTSDQQATYLPHLLPDDAGTGQPPRRPATAVLALQEPHPLADPLRPRTVAQRDGDHLVLTGVKALVPLAASAELLLVGADLDGAARLVIVPAGTPGVLVEDDPAMGLRAAVTGRVVLTDVRLPADHLLGSAQDHLDAVRRARLAWAACAVGTARAVLDQVIPYAKERTAFGEPIAHRQSVAFTIADIAIAADALRLTVWKAAARLDAGRDAAVPIAHARELTATHGASIGSDAVQLLGGHGFVKEWDNERWFRDLRGAGLLEGTLTV